MATTTPNYGWTVPTSTDLVKDGATAIETLGDAIDASMNTALGTKKAGLVLLNTTSFSAVSSVSLPNSTFSATYQNYKIHFQLTANSADQNLSMRMRASGADSTASQYNFASKGSDVAAGAFEFYANGLTTWTLAQTDGANSGSGYFMQWDVINPFDTKKTIIQGFSTGVSNSGSIYSLQGGGTYFNDLSFDSLTIYPSTGTITGSILVFGYNK